MGKKRSCVRVRVSTILWGVLAILLCAVPCVRADVTIPAGEPCDIDYAVTGTLWVWGTANLLTGASVSEAIYVQTDGTLNMYSGTIGTGWWISVSPDAAGMTVYGTNFAVNGDPCDYGEVILSGGMGTLTGNYGDGSLINLWIFSDTAINLQPLPSGGPQEIEIDIKPGSYPNAINLGSNGVIPVAILSDADFDATIVDPATVELAGSGVAVRGKANKYLAHEEDVNGDDLMDLVVKVETENLDPDTFQDGKAIVTGQTVDGVEFTGSDEITIVPPVK
jgi:hypothetical protein